MDRNLEVVVIFLVLNLFNCSLPGLMSLIHLCNIIKLMLNLELDSFFNCFYVESTEKIVTNLKLSLN